jgi:hypothetical protein
MTDPEDSATTIVIRRPAKVKTDDRGQTVWADAIEETEFDLMSSQELKLALQAANDVDHESMRAVAESGKDGVVARDRATGLYDVVSEAELREFLDADMELSASIRRHEMMPESADDSCANELSLVSTQALQRMLNQDDSEDSLEVLDDNPGCDPYDKG